MQVISGLLGEIHMAISRWAVLFAVTAALALGQDLAVENAIVSTTLNVGVSSSDETRPVACSVGRLQYFGTSGYYWRSLQCRTRDLEG